MVVRCVASGSNWALSSCHCFTGIMLMVAVLVSMVFMIPAVTATTPATTPATSPATATAITEAELSTALIEIRGNDLRMVRWSASEYTVEKQAAGLCQILPEILAILASPDATDDFKGMACEFATFCVTDNPSQRMLMSQLTGVHLDIVTLVASPNPRASAMACHLIYSSSFSNNKNHRAFYQAGAVKELAAVIKNVKAEPIQIMWAAAALQNLAASYCATDDDGRCYWSWIPSRDHVVLTSDSLPIISEGRAVRMEMHQDAALVSRLLQLACTGPVKGMESPSNPFPGEHAVDGTHDRHGNIVAWAATGALKNLALHPEARDDIETAMPCLCRLAHTSPDWLEENKGHSTIFHLRRGDPCWFGDSTDDYIKGGGTTANGGSGSTTTSSSTGDNINTDLNMNNNNNNNNINSARLCIDYRFMDNEGFTCSDYGGATDEECAAKNADGVTPNDRCCACGGGDRGQLNGFRKEL